MARKCFINKMEIYSGCFVVKEKEILRVTLIGLGWDPVLVHNKILITVGPEDRQESMLLKTGTDLKFLHPRTRSSMKYKYIQNPAIHFKGPITQWIVSGFNTSISIAVDFMFIMSRNGFTPCYWDQSLNAVEQNDTMTELIHGCKHNTTASNEAEFCIRTVA